MFPIEIGCKYSLPTIGTTQMSLISWIVLPWFASSEVIRLETFLTDKDKVTSLVGPFFQSVPPTPSSSFEQEDKPTVLATIAAANKYIPFLIFIILKFNE